MIRLDGNPVAPHAVVHHRHDFVAGHVAHCTTSMQQSVAPVASVLSPSENVRIVVAHASIEIHGSLQGSFSMLGPAFVDIANIHAAVFVVKGHRGLRLGIGGSHSGSHSGGGPVFIAGLSLRLHR